VKTYVRVVKSYRPGPGMTAKQATIQSFGYLEDQTDQEAFLAEVEAFDEGQRSQARQKQIIIRIPTDRKNADAMNRKQGYGYRFLESIYEQLGIGEFLDGVAFKGEYRLADVFAYLTFKRLLTPGSKRETMQEIRQFYNKSYDFGLADVYRAMDKFSEVSIALQKHLNERIQGLIGRDQSYAFYDVTNYYFATDFAGEKGNYQQKGVSKEHQLSPIVQMGLFMDSNQLPIAMSLFPGNTSDSVTIQPVMREIKGHYGLGRLVVVADKGLNSQANIDYIVGEGDGYVVSQVLRGPKGSRYREMVLDPEGYVGNSEYKYKLFEEEYLTKTTAKKKVVRKRKVLIYWSQEECDYAKKKREDKIQRAEKQLQNNAYGISHRADEYVTTENIIRSTGEVSDQAVQRLDYEKILEEEQMDGYFCILTSELEYTAQKIREVYHGLWRIEESFRITKSDLQTRPIFVRTQKHIEAHFVICYTALLIARLMQYHMGEHAISVDRLKEALNACTCVSPDGNAVLLDEIGGKLAFKEITTKKGEVIETLAYADEMDQIAEDYRAIQSAFGVSFDSAASTRESFNRYLKSIKFKPRKTTK
jgi:transposase